MAQPRNKLLYLSALICGAVLPLAFAPFYYWWLAILSSTALLFLILQAKHTTQAALIGFLFGLGYFGVGISWVYNSLFEFGGASSFVAGAITVLLIIFQSGYMALFAWLAKIAYTKLSNSYTIFVIAVTWFAIEWLKGIVLTGFPWLSLGYVHTASFLKVWAPWVGMYGLSAITLLISGVLLALVMRNYKQQQPAILLVVLIVAISPWLGSIKQTQAQSNALKITQIQGNIPQQQKWKPSERQNIFNVYWENTKQHWDSDLIVWPETAMPGRSELIEESVILPMSMIASENQTNILFGVLVSDLAKGIYYNSMLMVGEQQGMYHKRHLVPFGEYMPFRWALDFLNNYIRIPMSDMQSGEASQPMMTVGDTKLGVSICYEDVFSRDINKDLPEANILINTSNDAWFGDSLAPPQHLQIAQMRALETQRPMVRSTNTGISAFISAFGDIEQQSEQFKEDSLTQSVTGRTGTTWFVRLQPYQWGLVLLVALFYGVLYLRKTP